MVGIKHICVVYKYFKAINGKVKHHIVKLKYIHLCTLSSTGGKEHSRNRTWFTITVLS